MALNRAGLLGKVNRAAKLAYTPAGLPVLEFSLAVPQKYFDQESVGNFEILVVGPRAEEWASRIRVGSRIQIEGSLWTRTFRNRQGNRITETKVLADSIGGDDEKDGRQNGHGTRPGQGSRPR